MDNNIDLQSTDEDENNHKIPFIVFCLLMFGAIFLDASQVQFGVVFTAIGYASLGYSFKKDLNKEFAIFLTFIGFFGGVSGVTALIMELIEYYGYEHSINRVLVVFVFSLGVSMALFFSIGYFLEKASYLGDQDD